MRLRTIADAVESPHHGNLCRLLVRVKAHVSVADWRIPSRSEENGGAVCILGPGDAWGGSYVDLVKLSLVFAREAQARGGVLIHGALAERDGIGVILAAPGGMGKTTASNRLPSPWRSLCDDTTLVVRNPQGGYWAHPWPTWSRFLDGGMGGTWNVQEAVPLRGAFVLVQAAEDRVERVGPGHAVSLLWEAVEQVSAFLAPGLCKEELRAFHLERFENLRDLVGVVPVHLLHISLTGAFWHEIEQACSS